MSCNDDDSVRMACLLRSATVVACACGLVDATVSRDTVAKFAALQKNITALEAWVRAHAQDGEARAKIDAGWFGESAIADAALSMAQNVTATFSGVWSGLVAEIVAELQEVCPPMSLVNNPKVLVTENLQQTLRGMVAKLATSSAYSGASSQLDLMKLYEVDAGGSVPFRRERSLLVQGRKDAKVSIGLDYALDMVLHQVPADASDTPEFARRITSTLAKKGFGAKGLCLPGYMDRVLSRMAEDVSST